MRKQNKFKFYGYSIIFMFIFCGLQTADAFGQCSAPSTGSLGPKMPSMNVFGERCKTAIPQMKAASELLIGAEQSADVYNLTTLLAKDQRPQFKGKFDEGLTLSTALKWLKDYLAQENTSWLRKSAINNAMQNVYGRDAAPAELTFYDGKFKAKTETYTSIILSEGNKLNANAAERKAMIIRAYQRAMGRDAKTEELNYRQPHAGLYGDIILASRSYLYAPNGAKDLDETITRAYKAKGKNPPTGTTLTKAINFYKLNKMIYTKILEYTGFKDGMPGLPF